MRVGLIGCCRQGWRRAKAVREHGDKLVVVADIDWRFQRGIRCPLTVFWKISPSEDNAFCFLHTEKGQVVSIRVSWTQWKNLFSFEIFDQEGYITVEGLGGIYDTEQSILGRRDFLKPFEEKVMRAPQFHGQERKLPEYISARRIVASHFSKRLSEKKQITYREHS